MIYPGEEYCIAIMVPGTLCVLMAGIQLGRKQELSVKLLDKLHLTIVSNLLCQHNMYLNFHFECKVSMQYVHDFIEAALIDYGRGGNPILPFSIQCDSNMPLYDISNCSKVVLDTNQCINIAGVDCKGLLSFVV